MERPALGYAMALASAAMFGINGAVIKVALGDGMSAYRLAELRCLFSFAIFVLVVAAWRPERLRVGGRELIYLAVFGACAVVLTQLLYVLALRRLKIGVALVLIFLGPLLVALWSRFVGKRQVRPRFWVALGLSLVGVVLVVRVWDSFSLDGLGVAFALCGAAAYALYVLTPSTPSAGATRSRLCFGFLFACLLWTIAQPWWSLPWQVLGTDVSLDGNLAGTNVPEWALVAWVVVLGTVVPFILVVGALQHLPATTRGDLRDARARRRGRRRVRLAGRDAGPRAASGRPARARRNRACTNRPLTNFRSILQVPQNTLSSPPLGDANRGAWRICRGEQSEKAGRTRPPRWRLYSDRRAPRRARLCPRLEDTDAAGRCGCEETCRGTAGGATIIVRGEARAARPRRAGSAPVSRGPYRPSSGPSSCTARPSTCASRSSTTSM